MNYRIERGTYVHEKDKKRWGGFAVNSFSVFAFHLGNTIVAVPFTLWYRLQVDASKMEPFNLALQTKGLVLLHVRTVQTKQGLTSSLSQATISP